MQHIHFVGIGGIGMSGIATILRTQGFHISGCDTDVTQKSVRDLLAHGCIIHAGNNTNACSDPSIDIVVYSSDIRSDHPELESARQRSIPTIQRATMLAELMRTKYSIAISGSHGKTTTTSLIAHILMEAELDPTIIVGGHLKNLSTNARLGSGDLLVAEADESDKSFLKLSPTLAVVTNIDFEHVNIYHDVEDVKKTFIQFLHAIPFYGKAFLCVDDPQVRSLLPLHQIKTVTYGIDTDATLVARDIVLAPTYSLCTIWKRNDTAPLGSLFLTMPGRHNILNATAATAVALDLGVPFATITRALANFSGIERRFSCKGIYRGAALFDDYGHHPTEIAQTLIVARKRATKRLVVAFQPHRYSRTQGLWQEFLHTFTQYPVDHLIITDIYGASETPIPSIHSKEMVAQLQALVPFPVSYIPYDHTWQQVQTVLHNLIQPDDLVLFLGAGKINQVAELLKQHAQETT